MLEGELHPDFSAVAKALGRILPKKGPGGAAACVYHRGRKVVDIWGGSMDSEGTPWRDDTVSVSFSTTKGIASTLVHVLADRGLLDYDAPVADVWPEFGQAGKHAVTLRQVMSHEAGLYHVADLVDDASDLLDWSRMTQLLAEAEPCHRPGEAHGYHALTYGFLVGEVARRVSDGKPFAELIEREIAAPLSLDGLFCGLPANEIHRAARLISPMMDAPEAERAARMEKTWAGAERWRRRLHAVGFKFDPRESLRALLPPGMQDFDMNHESVRAASIPAANGCFTARSLARLYACLAAGGELDGVRLLSPETLSKMSRVQNRGIGRVIPFPMNWRLGYHRVAAFGSRVPQGFGHFGFGGSGAWADPSRELSVALTVNSGVGTPFGDLRIVRIGGAAVRCADRR